MSESLDQPAAGASAPASLEVGATAQPPLPAKTEMLQEQPSDAGLDALANAGEPDKAAASKAAGLPATIVIPPRAKPDVSVEAEAASAAEAKTVESPLNFVPFQSVPPRHKKGGLAVGDYLLRAAAIAIAVGTGWIAGANTFDRGTEVHRLAAQLDATQAKLADVAKAARLGRDAGLATLKTDMAALRKSVDGLGKGLDTQRAGLGTARANVEAMKGNLDATKANLDATRGDLESLKTALQATQAGLDASKPDAAKLDRLAERIDRLEHQYSALMPTGSIASASTPPAVAPAAPAQPSPPSAKDSHALPSKDQRPADKPKIPANGYVLRDVHDGVAIVEDRTGLHEISPGELLAGIGRVQSIERRGRRWVVVTSEGLIDSDPY
jgi:hypothetical protein